MERAGRLLADAKSVVVLTGAGVSAESGLATFREPEQGLWARYDPMELAHIDAFYRDPELVTRWYHWRFTRARDAQPNDGHRALARLQEWLTRDGRGFRLITQNIDGLHQRAGSRDVVELHGTILIWRCTKTGDQYPLDTIDFSSFPPRSSAGGVLRPNVVWFGEALPEKALEAASDAAESCDVFVSVGTSALVWPAAGFIEVARRSGAATIEVNLDATPNSEAVDISLRGSSGELLPRLLDRAQRLRAAEDQ